VSNLAVSSDEALTLDTHRSMFLVKNVMTLRKRQCMFPLALLPALLLMYRYSGEDIPFPSFYVVLIIEGNS
jgi:hypothetical protein